MANELQEQKKTQTMAEYIESISSGIMTELQVKQNQGLVLPPNYAAQNALLSAIFKIKQTVDKDKNPALKVCSPDSVKQTVMEMMTKGLDPNKNQCYFIVYGDKLTLFPSYFGILHMAKEADPNIRDIYAEVVYDGDTFKYQIKNGAKVVTAHEQDPDNIDLTKIKGAYATIVYRDGREVSEYMSMQQIKNSWVRGQTKGKSDAHELAPEEMAKRTVLKRLVKNTINTSNDEQLLTSISDIDEEAEQNEATVPIDITPTESYAMPKDAKPVKFVEAPKSVKADPIKTVPEPQETEQVDDIDDFSQMEIPDILK